MKLQRNILALFLFSLNLTENPSLRAHTVVDRKEMVSLIQEARPNLFLIFLSDSCKFCNQLMEVLPEVVEKASQRFKAAFNLKLFHCPKDGFCGEQFKVEGYPDIRFYPQSDGFSSNFVKHRNPPVHSLEDLMIFIQNRLVGQSFQKKASQLDEFIQN